MNHSARFRLCCYVLLTLSVFTAHAQTRDGWERIDHCNLRREGKNGIRYVAFLDKRQGIIAGDAGFIRYTTNGGITWRPATVPKMPGGQIADNILTGSRHDRTLYLVTLQRLLRSEDGGRTWDIVPQPLTAGQIAKAHGGNVKVNNYDVFFVSEKKGWVLCAVSKLVGTTETFVQSYLMYTKNGGGEWKRHKLPTANRLVQMYFASEKRGWVVGDRGTILYTDNGDDWDIQPFPVREGAAGAGQPPKLFDVDFNGRRGIIVGQAGTMLFTEDYDGPWFHLDLPPPPKPRTTWGDLVRVQMTDDQHAWAVGDGGVILYTDTWSGSWSVQASAVADDLYTLYMLDKELGWAAGNKNALLRYDFDDARDGSQSAREGVRRPAASEALVRRHE